MLPWCVITASRWREVYVRRWFVWGMLGWIGLGCGAEAPGESPIATQEEALGGCPPDGPSLVGLSLMIKNGQSDQITLLTGPERYLQELDLTESVTSTTDEGITPLVTSSGLKDLDWRGVELVEETWNPSLDGTMTRERYYRGAKWMELPSTFKVRAVNAAGRPVGAQWVLQAGRDDRMKPGDDVFVRRFVARQTAVGCASVGDCSGAVFVSEALVQVRGNLAPAAQARAVPAGTAALEVTWNRLPHATFTVPVQQIPAAQAEFGYGFDIELTPISTPANGQFYEPNESVSFRVTFRDGNGKRLHPEGQLPSYGEFLAGQVTSGLRYLDLQLPTRLYYALKHRESNLLAVLSGPKQALKTAQGVVDPLLFFAPQVPFATEAVDGYTALGQVVPSAALVFGGFQDASLWNVPVTDVLTFTLPADAQPGTYVAAIKARREFAGEALNRGASAEIQVGQPAVTAFSPKTACVNCHAEERKSLSTLLHGFYEPATCFGCHTSLGIEFDNALDIRVHTIHSRSNRFPANVENCALCHTSAPGGPARGL